MNEITVLATQNLGGISTMVSPIVSTSVSYGSAFLGGLLSFFSPCVLPLIPIFFGVLMSGVDKGFKRFWRGASFAIGMSLFFFLLGIGAGGLGTFINKNQFIMNVISGSLFIVFGFLFLFNIGFKNVNVNFSKFKNSIFSGFIIGSLMGIVWVPCAGPILGSILVIAANQNTVIEGGMLLIIYSLGMIIPFLFLSGVVAKISSRINFSGESKVRKILRIVVFALLVITGILTITGQLNLLQFS